MCRSARHSTVRSRSIVDPDGLGFKIRSGGTVLERESIMPEVPAATGIDSGSALSYHRAASGSIRDGEIAGGAMGSGEGRVGLKKPGAVEPPKDAVSTAALRVALLYDMDACYAPTGVTRHALAQLERLARRPEIALTAADRADEPPGRPGVLGVAGAALASRASATHPRPVAMVARQAVAADRVVDRTARLDLLPGRVLRADAAGAESGHQPRCSPAPSLRGAPQARADGPRLRAGRPDPVGLAFQHRAVAGGISFLPRSSGVRAQRRR